jgi:Flp pilus assembly protein TadG
MAHSAPHDDGERGQILVIFTLAVVVIIGMVGLVLDGGSAFAQRRDVQSVADLAAVAGATAYLNTPGTPAAKAGAAQAAARNVATANGYTAGTDGTSVDVDVVGYSIFANVSVGVTSEHRNNFSGLVGMPKWDVSVKATATSSGRPNGAIGAMPLLFNAEAFPGAVCDESAGPCVPEVYQLPGTGTEDVPQDGTQFNWTIFCTANGNPCNGDSDGVRDLINGNGSQTTVFLEDDIGPLNAGAHVTLFTRMSAHAGETFPVPIVNDDGDMMGWAYFKLLGVEGASEKVLRGYFVSPVNGVEMVVSPTGGTSQIETGAYLVKLID